MEGRCYDDLLFPIGYERIDYLIRRIRQNCDAVALDSGAMGMILGAHGYIGTDRIIKNKQ